MNYQNARDTLRSGDVLAWTHRRLRSWYDLKVMAVRLFQMSEYSHVGLAIVQDGRVWVLESVVPVVRLVPLSGELPCYVISGNGLTEAQRLRGLALVGRGRYSQWEAIKAFFGFNSRRNDAWECAELVADVLDLDVIDTPSALVAHLLAQGATLREIAGE